MLSKHGCSLGKKGVTGSSICSEIGAFKNNYKASQQQKKMPGHHTIFYVAKGYLSILL